VKEGEVMGVESACASSWMRSSGASAKSVMTARGKIGLWLKLVAPGLIDRIARRAIERGR
jgi:hypothetical protein